MATPVMALNQWSSVTPLGMNSDWFCDALGVIADLADLHDNWDSYGSPPIQVAAREAAGGLLSILSACGSPAPHIAPVPRGGIQLEWLHDGRELELEILPRGDLEFLATFETGEMSDGELTDWNRQVPYLINWLRTGDIG